MSKIIRANNRQTTVGNEAFEILSPFHKYLEEFYLAKGKETGTELYYERRSNQYEPLDINRHNYITLSNQTKSVIGMYFNEPHNAAQRYFGELLKIYKSKLFLENHLGYPYYVSGLCMSKLEQCFATYKIPRRYKRFKYHIMMLIRILATGIELPPFNSRKMEKDANKIISILNDEKKFSAVTSQACRKIDDVLSENNVNYRNAHGLSRFRDLLLPPTKTNRTIGTVSYYNDMRGFGYINIGTDNDIWFHISDYHNSISGIPSIGDKLSIDIVDNEKGFRAINIQRDT